MHNSALSRPSKHPHIKYKRVLKDKAHIPHNGTELPESGKDYTNETLNDSRG